MSRTLPNQDLEVVLEAGRERYVTPTDETGLPYCFAPTIDLPPVSFINQFGEKPVADLNHQFPKKEVELSNSPALEGLGRPALSSLRVQWVDYDQHHGPYNHEFVGPGHPQTIPSLFRTAVMGSAGYIPKGAIDLSGPEPGIVRLTNKQRKWLWTSGQVRVACSSDVNSFLRWYVLSQDMDHISQNVVEEFVYTFDYSRRLSLGIDLANKVAEKAAESVEDTYQQARRQDVLTFIEVGGKRRGAPNNARDFVRDKLFYGGRFKFMQAELQKRFAAEPRRAFKVYFSEVYSRATAGELSLDQQR